MFGSKINSQSFKHHYNTVKSFLGHKYNQTRHALSHLDNGVRVFKQIYAAAAPIIDHYNGGNLHSQVVKGIGTYDELKHKLIDVDNHATNLHQKIKHIL